MKPPATTWSGRRHVAGFQKSDLEGATHPASGNIMPLYMHGYIRLTNKRANAGSKPTEGEAIVDFDRANPTLGNRHILHDHNNPVERDRVIAAYKVDLDADWARKGRMHDSIVLLARRVLNGDRIAGRCWCEPRKCHGSLIIDRVKEIIREQNPQHPFVRPNE